MLVLYNLAHKESSIKSLDGEAWIRILGFFNTKQEALAHTQSLSKLDEGIEIRLAPVGDFRVMLRSKYLDRKDALDMSTRNREAEKHSFLLDAHKLSRENAFKEVAKNAQGRQMGDLKFSESDRISSHAEEFASKDSQTLQQDAPKYAETPAVKKISNDLEIRMQRFAAIALIPDYEHSEYLDAQLALWESKRDAAYSFKRNEKISSCLGTKSIPSFRELSEKWVTDNPPPKGYNVWGHQSEDLWIKNLDDKVSDNSEVRAWLKTFHIAREDALWTSIGETKPDRAVALRDWFGENSLPNDAGAEPAIAFLKPFETEHEVKDWIQDKCPLKDVDVACVSMYEWIRLRNAWSDNVFRTFRNPMVKKLYDKKEYQKAEALKLEGLGAKEIIVNN
jgi:hypothetical protein